MNRIDRLMAIALHLQGRRVTRAEDLAEHFEVSVRTIYRDVSALSEAGVPVVAEAGVGYSLMKGYYLPPIMFTSEEAAALGTAAMALSQTSDPSLEASMRSALLKVRAVLPQSQKDRLERIERSVTFGWAERPKESLPAACLVDVQAALADARPLRVNYRSGGRQEISTREIEPLGLIHYLERWHLIAWCRLREDFRDFRLDRIERMETLPGRVPYRDDFNLQRYMEQQRPGIEQTQVKVFFSTLSVDRAKRDWSLGIVDEKQVEGGSELTLSTGDMQWMLGWLLSFRDRIRVIDPPELRSLLAEESATLARHHETV